MAVQVSLITNCKQCEICNRYNNCKLGRGDDTPALVFGWDIYHVTILCESFEFNNQVLEANDE